MEGGFICLVFPLLLLVMVVVVVELGLPQLFIVSVGADDHRQVTYCTGQGEFCGRLNVSYPFFVNNWGCALEHLHCINGSTPVINSRRDSEDSIDYVVHSIDYTTRTALFHYNSFTQALLNDADKCKFLFYNFTTMPPIFHHLLTQLISPRLTLRVCINNKFNITTTTLNQHQEYLNINGGGGPGGGGVNYSSDYCKVEALPVVNPTAPAPAPISPNDHRHSSPYDDCKLIYFPVDLPPSTIFHAGPLLVSQLFTFGFRVRWSFLPLCHQCEKNGTLCARYDEESQFCFNPKNVPWNPGHKGNKKHRKIIALGVPTGVAGGILLTILFSLAIYKFRVKHNQGVPRNYSLNTDPEKSFTHLGIPIFSYAELEEATDNFSSVNELGDGGSGTVYQGKLLDGRVVAIKRLYHNDSKNVERFMNEIKILTCLSHKNLVCLYGCTSYRSHELLLIYEFIPNGTVADHLHGDRRKVGSLLPWHVRMSIAIETASALSYLHASDIIHRDVKTNNILLDNHFHVKVADFGFCRMFPADASHVSTAPMGTPGYVDPEYHQCYQLTDKSDVYSFGVVLIELISSKPAFDISRHRDEINLASMAMRKIQNGALEELVDPCLGFQSDCRITRTVTLVIELAFRCLQEEKELRPSMNEVLEALMTSSGGAAVEDQYCKVVVVEDKEVDNNDAKQVRDILTTSYNDEHLPDEAITLPPPLPPPPASMDSGSENFILQ